MSRLPDRSGYVYFLRLGRYVKIGFSQHPGDRVVALDNLPWEPKLLHRFFSPNARTIERALHARFAKVRKRKEWFRLTKEDITLCRSVIRVNDVGDLPEALRPPDWWIARLQIRRVYEANYLGLPPPSS